MVYCSVPSCKSKGTRGFHAFPTDMQRALRWMKRTKTLHLLEEETTSGHKICEKHFKERDLVADTNGRRCLMPDALPCLFLPELTIDYCHNYASTSRIQKRRRIRKYKPMDPNDVLTSDSEINIIGAEVEIASADVEILLELNWHENMRYIKLLEEKLLQTKKEKTMIAASLRYNCKQVKHLRQVVRKSKLDDDAILGYLIEKKNFNKEQLAFLQIQLRNAGRKLRGRRYTPEEKSLCLAIYKQSPKNYRFMKRMFLLPSKTTLGRHSAKLLFESGIDPKLLEFIKEQVKNWGKVDLYCTEQFDEMAIKAHLDYNKYKDIIDGFVEMAGVRRPTFATHALTFMIRGINIPFKLPIAYFLTDGLKSFELAELIKLVTKAVLKTGLNVIGSICDQAITNESAIKKLIGPDCSKGGKGKLLSYTVQGKKIIHCYDPPHLIKVVRNNMRVKNLKHFIEKQWDKSSSNKIGKQQLAMWTDVENLYQIDSRRTQRLLPKISDQHMNPTELKMKVSVATQVFSRTYGKVMLHCVEKKQLPKESSETAQILIFFNDLFDSINGSGEPQDGKLKGSISEHSAHFDFWNYAILMLSKMEFIDKQTGETNIRSTVLYKFQSTIRGYMEISRICLNANMKKVCLRNTNQDGLENFFSCVKTCCQAAKTPTAIQFRCGYSTMIFNNLTGSNSLKSNCEPDSSFSLLNNIHKFLVIKQDNNVRSNNLDAINEAFAETSSDPLADPLPDPLADPLPDPLADPFADHEMNFTENEMITFVSNVICRKILKTTICPDCRSNMQRDSALSAHDIITAKENFDDLTYPSEIFMENFKKIFCHINKLIPSLCSTKSIKMTLLSRIEDTEMDAIGCSEHDDDIVIKLKEFSINYALDAFCKNINNLLAGKITVDPYHSNCIQALAVSFRQKKKRIGKYSHVFTL